MSNSTTDLKFETLFLIAVTSMKMNRSYPSISRDKIWLAQFIVMLTMAAFCFFFLSYSVFVHDIKCGNYTEACKNCTMIVICINTNIKYAVLLYYQESITDLIKIIDRDYKLALRYPENEKEIVIHHCQEGNKVCKFWLVCATCASAIFPLKALSLTAYSYFIGEKNLYPLFDVTYPQFIEIHKDETPVFICLFTLTFSFAVFSATMFIGFDPLIPIFTLHVSGQLEILSSRIQLLSAARNENDMEKTLEEIIKKTQDLYHFVSRCQKYFKILNEFNMKSTTITVTLSAFQIVEYLRMNKINIEFNIMFFGGLLHFLMPCYYNNLLMEKSEKFRQAIYNCGWEMKPHVRVRKTILFMLMRASKPFAISTIFYAINLETFAAMCHEAYTLFNLMNASLAI